MREARAHRIKPTTPTPYAPITPKYAHSRRARIGDFSVESVEIVDKGLFYATAFCNDADENVIKTVAKAVQDYNNLKPIAARAGAVWVVTEQLPPVSAVLRLQERFPELKIAMHVAVLESSHPFCLSTDTLSLEGLFEYDLEDDRFVCVVAPDGRFMDFPKPDA